MENGPSWTRRNAMFPGFDADGIPELNTIRDLFLCYEPVKWTTDAGIFYSADNGDLSNLHINDNPDYGFWIMHKVRKNGQTENAFSLGDKDSLDEYVPIGDDSVTLKGLFIPPERAWLAVKFFVSTEGGRTNEIEWILEKDIPKGMHWLVSVDCL